MPLDKEEGERLFKDLQVKLTEYGNSLETQMKDLVSKGLGESDKKVEDLKKEIGEVNTVMKSMQQQLVYIGKGVPGLREELESGKSKFSIGNLTRALVRQVLPEFRGSEPWKNAEFEKEVCKAWDDELAKRKATGNYMNDGASGGVLVPPEVMEPVSLIARESNPIESLLPITVIPNVFGQIEIPTITGGTTTYMVGENEAPTTSKLTFGKITANPKRAAGLCFISKSLLFNSTGVDSLISTDLGQSLGAKKHQQAIAGTGSDDQVTGLMHSKWTIPTSTLSGDTNGGRFNITDALLVKAELEEALELAGVPEANLAFLMRPIVKAGLATERVKNYADQAAKRGQPVIQNMGIIDDATLTSIIGKFAKSTYLPATETKGTSAASMSSVYYGDWKRFWMLNWQGMSIKISDIATVGGVSAFAQNAVWVVIEEGFNCVVTRPNAFRRVTGAQCNPKLWD